MRRFLLAASTALALAACADAVPTEPSAGAVPAAQAILDPTIQTVYTIFTTHTPDTTLDTGGSAWAVGTRFYTTEDGCVVGFRFWRAVGETGSHTFSLWTSSGTRIVSRTFSPTGSGWKSTFLNFGANACLDAYQFYVVSVNTNSKQVKSFGTFAGGSTVTNGTLVATKGQYGQPGTSYPATLSDSNFFVDVYFEPNP
jgi:hypothetical protein